MHNCHIEETQCFVAGECTNSGHVTYEEASDENECLQICKTNQNCLWFTFFPESKVCHILTRYNKMNESKVISNVK